MRKRRNSRDRKPKFDQKKVKYILVEGETEKNYINYLKSLFKLNYELKLMNKSTLESNIYITINRILIQKSISIDELILVYDLENDENEAKKFINNDKLVHTNTYLTQPCIEYHFLLHYKEAAASTNKYRTANDAETELLTYLPNYKKGNGFIWNKSGITSMEVSFAKERSSREFDSYQQKSFSTLGKFIEDHFIDA